MTISATASPVQYFTLPTPFQLEAGSQLQSLKIAYTTQGELSPDGDNVIWVFHAFTGSADATEWWSELVGEGKVLDPSRYFIVCANMPGSCYGSTFAKDTNPDTGQPYGQSFPDISIHDMVKAYRLLRDHLGIKQALLGIGGSMGGQQLLEWAVQETAFFQHICVMASNARHSAWGIAFNEAQRMALLSDPTLFEASEGAGKDGLAAARAVAMLSYRNYRTYQFTQADEDDEKLDTFRAASYQQYQGEKLYRRFHPLSYLTLSKAMDSHNVGRGRGGAEAALATIKSNALVIGIESDVLFPVEEQAFIANHIPKARLEVIESIYGHDGFLVEHEAITRLLKAFLEQKTEFLPPAKYKRRSQNNGTGDMKRLALPGTESF